jgi:hypothetical protein
MTMMIIMIMIIIIIIIITWSRFLLEYLRCIQLVKEFPLKIYYRVHKSLPRALF